MAALVDPGEDATLPPNGRETAASTLRNGLLSGPIALECEAHE